MVGNFTFLRSRLIFRAVARESALRRSFGRGARRVGFIWPQIAQRTQICRVLGWDNGVRVQ